jgi:hypothetical protein
MIGSIYKLYHLNLSWALEGPGIMDNPFSAQGLLLLKPNI